MFAWYTGLLHPLSTAPRPRRRCRLQNTVLTLTEKRLISRKGLKRPASRAVLSTPAATGDVGEVKRK